MVSCLQVENLSGGYRSRVILKGISFALQVGEVVAILGPNATGKTTLLKYVSGYLAPWEGKVYLFQQPLHRLPGRYVACRLAVVPQTVVPNFPFTVHQFVLMGRNPHLSGIGREKEEDFRLVREAMETTGIWHLRDRPVTELSGGERQKAYLARALAQEPRVLILDEPTAYLDLSNQKEIMNLIASLARERQIAVMAILHDINLAARYCQRLIFIKEGRVVAEGPPEEVVCPEVIREVYGTEVYIIKHPQIGVPQVLV